MKRFGALVAGSCVVGAGAFAASDERSRRRTIAIAEAGWRAGRLASTVGLIALDYKYHHYSSGATAQQGKILSAVDELEQQLEVADREAKRREALLAQCIAEGRPKGERAQLQKEAKEAMDVAAGAAEDMVAARRKMLEESGGDLALRMTHKRAAERLLKLARQNSGVYIKLAQHLSQMDYVLPEEYCDTLRQCLDDAPQSSYQDVCQVVQEELGGLPSEVFASFEPVPIASASLAQVHVATHKDSGQKLAVKVQHRGLRDTSTGDVDCVSLAVRGMSTLFPSMPLWWIADELAPNLPIELDFKAEARNADKCREMFSGDSRIAVPDIVHELSSSRVLTMSFEDGVSVADIKEIEKLGIRPSDVAALISEAFCTQVFMHQFVHCDPHPANILVRKIGKDKKMPQLVILDHGLYRNLDESFVHDYCLLWQALVFGDVQGIRRQCQLFGAGEMYPLLAAMLTARPWNHIIDDQRESLSAPDTDEDRHKIKTYVAKYAVDIGAMMNNVPRQMLLLFKANDCLRHLDRRLGSPANTLIITARVTSRAIALRGAKRGQGMTLMSRLRNLLTSVRVETSIMMWLMLRRLAQFREGFKVGV